MDMTDPSRLPRPEDGERGRWLISLPGFSSENSYHDNISLSELYGAIRRRYPLILACIMVITVFCTAIVFQLTPLYTAESELLIDQHKIRTSNLDLQSAVAGLSSDSTAIQSEVDVLQSADIAGAVVEKAGLLDVPEFNSRLRRDSGLGLILQPFYWTVSGVRSLFTPRSAEQDDPAHAELFSVIRALQAHTDIVNDGKSYVLKIYVDSEDPKLAATIANAYADAYLDAQLEARFQAAQRASGWLSDHLNDLRTKTEAADQAVQEFAAAHNLTPTLSNSGNVTSQQISELNTQLVLASADLAQKQAALQQVKNSIHTGGISATSQVLSSPLIQNLREQESMLLTQQANLATRYQPEHPAMINIAAQIRDLNQKIQDETNRIVNGMEGDVAAARAKVDSLRQSETDLQSSPQTNDAQVQLHELQREADASRTIYEGFLNRYKQTSAQEDIPEPDARIVSHAMVPAGPSFPKKMPLIFMAFIGSTIIGAFAAIGMELLDVGFRTGEQLEKVTRAPMLGIEPALDSGDSPLDVVVERPLSSYSVALQSIRTALRYSDVDNPPKVVLVTSSLSNEGKTVFATSFARSAAKSGIKTLLIDCDLRRPSVAKLFHVESKPDLLSFFDGITDKTKIINIDPDSGLRFITAPADTPNPQDLLGSIYMRSLIDLMREHYDLIVLDTPPLLAVPDAVGLSHAADATIFLVRWAKTPRKVVREALKSFHALGGKLAGVVLSRVDMRKYATYGYSDPDYYYEYAGQRKKRGARSHTQHTARELTLNKIVED